MDSGRFRTDLRTRKWLSPAALLAVGGLLMLAACSAPTGKGPAGATPKPGEIGRYKVGTPYTVNGVTYHPAVQEDYDRTGVASWYGPNFHGKLTANGEIFDMNALTAAHPTLPMPSMVRVTNLDNGRTITLRINDRGPFARGRIIDVSRRGAQLLGFRYKGVTRVRVEYMKPESRRLAAIAKGEIPPVASQTSPEFKIINEPLPRTVPVVETTPLPAPKTPQPPQPQSLRNPEAAPIVQQAAMPEMATKRYFVQAGAFQDYNNAIKLWNALSPLGPAVIIPESGAASIYRVRLGPYADVDDAEGLAAIIASKGRGDAHVIADRP